MLVLYILFSLAISWFNAWSVGKSWTDSKAMGGVARFMAWCGGIMSAVGFTWCYFILVAIGLQASGKVTPEQAQQFLNLGYLAVIIPCIGSGTAITVQSWAHFWKRKTFGNGAVATWNTFADVYNIVSAFEHVPSAWSSVGDLFSMDSDDDGVASLLLMLAVLALGAGIVTTMLIVRTVNARTVRDLQMRAIMEQRS